ncbi:hypothetical protein SMC26_09615 [Actinomadura fulvescens]|uniref:DUF6879 domain-containing protein n=1 Tax=Actinomadura fulvescens TaxID=46160 RepID=A0ABP6CDZ9_9ACTN
MELISTERRNELIDSASLILKLELRDAYAVDAVLLDAWRAGDPQGVVSSFVESWADGVREDFERGQRTRRIRVVSEPLSEYQRYLFDVQTPAVEAGEDIRWLPRRLTSSLLLPGNDMFVLDGDCLVFNVLGGDNQRAEIQFSDDPAMVKSCRDAFEAAWSVSIRHREYRPTP